MQPGPRVHLLDLPEALVVVLLFSATCGGKCVAPVQRCNNVPGPAPRAGSCHPPQDLLVQLLLV